MLSRLRKPNGLNHHRRESRYQFALSLALLLACASIALPQTQTIEPLPPDATDDVLRVFIFAGQSNMVGSDSRVADIDRFPPFAGLDQPQANVHFAYSIGRQSEHESAGWTTLQPVNQTVGPELSFARELTRANQGPIAIIKCAAGGTHLGGDWNPDDPIGFEMYPRMMRLIKQSLADLEQQGIPYRVEALMWHQGENDMFNPTYQKNYGNNLARFLQCLRRDLDSPKLPCFIGELCTKTIWGMDLRPRMYAISQGQKQVTTDDPNAHYVRTSHVGVEIGSGVGLHYHYGTLGQLEHGVNYAHAYLTTLGRNKTHTRTLNSWPYPTTQPVKLFILAGHRNMEGERAFAQQLKQLPSGDRLAQDNPSVAFKYSLGGGYRQSNGWEPLGLVDYYDTFGPELSFAETLKQAGEENFAIAKFTHSGSQIIDWTPTGSEAVDRNLYPKLIEFIRDAVNDLESRGNQVELAGIIYHVGENDMSFYPYRRTAAKRLAELIQTSRQDLKRPDLHWFISQQAPTDHEQVNEVDVLAEIAAMASKDPHVSHFKAVDLPPQDRQLVLDTAAVVQLGKQLANFYLQSR